MSRPDKHNQPARHGPAEQRNTWLGDAEEARDTHHREPYTPEDYGTRRVRHRYESEYPQQDQGKSAFSTDGKRQQFIEDQTDNMDWDDDFYNQKAEHLNYYAADLRGSDEEDDENYVPHAGRKSGYDPYDNAPRQRDRH